MCLYILFKRFTYSFLTSNAYHLSFYLHNRNTNTHFFHKLLSLNVLMWTFFFFSYDLVTQRMLRAKIFFYQSALGLVSISPMITREESCSNQRVIKLPLYSACLTDCMLAPLWSEAQNNQNPNNLILQISFLIERESQTTVKKFHGAGHHFILFHFWAFSFNLKDIYYFYCFIFHIIIPKTWAGESTELDHLRKV